MTPSFTALCSDFYINQKLALKMDLPAARETVLDMCDRIRKQQPHMERFLRYDGEYALESTEAASRYSWMALRQTSVRSGWVNPESLDEAYALHKLILEVAPYYLSISPLDVDYLELVYGFDLEAGDNRNEVIFDALLSDSPLAGLVDAHSEPLLDVQPFVGFALDSSTDTQCFVEVKSRVRPADVGTAIFSDEPISVYLTVRYYGSLPTIEDFQTTFDRLSRHAESLADDRVIPHVVMPIRNAIVSRPG
jgi:hypothetical protein